jgi:hypothetical protein
MRDKVGTTLHGSNGPAPSHERAKLNRQNKLDPPNKTLD